MPLDHSTATATILLDGLGLFCFNSAAECEIAVLKNVRHSLTVDVLKVRPDGIFPVEHRLNLTTDVLIDTDDDVNPGVSRYRPTAGFSRRVGPFAGDHDDFEDFRWIVDLEAFPFHERRLTIDKHPTAIQIECELAPLIRITQGVFYSSRLTGLTATGVQDIYKLTDWHGTEPVTLIENFTLADVIGVDIQIHKNDGSLRLQNKIGANPPVPGSDLVLRKEADTRYLISIKNICSAPVAPSRVGSDFRKYYDVVSDASRPVKFDFDKRIKGRPPQNCDFAFLGLTDTLTDPEPPE